MAKQMLVTAVLASFLYLIVFDNHPANALTKALPGGKPLAFGFKYGETMLVLVSDQGVVVVFPEGTEAIARYQFRYESKDKKVKESGSGMVFEKKRVARLTGKPGELELIDEGSETRLKARPIEVEWSSCGKSGGWIYYVSEKVHASIGQAKDSETIDLKRFFKNN